MKNITVRLSECLLVALMISFSSQPSAALLHDIGYTALRDELGVLTPDGSGVHVSLVEAFSPPCDLSSDPSACKYLPDTSIGSFNDKSNGFGLSTETSDHASGSANNFYGSSSSSPSIRNIDVYAADHWLADGYLNLSTPTSTSLPATSSTRVSSHSYVGSAGTSSLEVLQGIDFLADKDDHILSIAVNNGSDNRPLNGSAYNVIAVGRTDADHSQGTVDVNSGTGLYNTTTRSRPDIVIPESSTSAATPRVASAAALLTGYGHDQALNKSKGSVSNRNNDTIYHAETSEVIKASLMAGASRSTSNTDAKADIINYRSNGNETTNGLDTRYGAGQLNIQNSFHILAAGEQDARDVFATGFDYDNSFGGLNGSNNTASYFFTNNDNAWFAASLVWNIAFDISSEETFTESVASLFDLNLSLSVLNGSLFEEFISSTSVIDNTENIWSQLSSGSYRLDVTSNGNFDHDYGLAWQTSAVPIPGSVWLFFSALSGLVLIRRRNDPELISIKLN